MAVPSTPTNLKAHRTFDNAVMLKWDSVSGANGYYLYISKDGGTTFKRTGNYNTNSGRVTGLKGNTGYDFKVSAYNDDGESALSTALHVTTRTGNDSYDLWLLPGTQMSVVSDHLYLFEETDGLLGWFPIWNELFSYSGAFCASTQSSLSGYYWGVPDIYNPDDDSDYNEGSWWCYSESMIADSDLIWKIRQSSSTWAEIFRLYGEGGAKLPSTDALYFGDKDTDGSWRIIRSGNNLVFQRRESGSWVTKSTISA